MRLFSQSNFKNVTRKKSKKELRSEHEQALGARGRKMEGERSRKPWSLVSPLRARAGGSEHAG